MNNVIPSMQNAMLLLLFLEIENHRCDFMGISWVFPKLVKGALFHWKGSFVGKKRLKIRKYVPLCIFWTIWKERKCIAFRDGTLAV